ncbi:bacteriohemerythrin [Desulforhopalus singaporensis]|uniref:Hemerythrin n=1 Tax=Desulforhopalus singaporensis TaxID=91360 RepID=A0A1H0V4D5_9BACT|nr:bacteriohemerythrin [Desulforhopalus singaporensis]SDP73028.1 hemerythrin [Desulforhopalus singaporensis]
MENINWKKEFSVGVQELDQQHKKLLSMINRLIDDQKKLTDPKLINELLMEMIDYAEVHFQAEEHLMTEYNYHYTDRQAQQHQQFIEKTRSFLSATDVGPNILSNALLDYLGNWLINHILTEDMKYKDFFQSKGIDQSYSPV